jgi:hypothetical protein
LRESYTLAWLLRIFKPPTSFLEIQALIVEMVGNFQFSHVVDPARIRRETSAIMGPVVEGEESKGLQLPIRLTRYNLEQQVSEL